MELRASSFNSGQSLVGVGQGVADRYRKALGHSARVRRLKVLLPIAAVVISLSFMAVSYIRTMFPDNLTIAGAKIENGRVVMEKPAISGRNQDGLSYFMNARRALQAIINPSDIALEDIDAAVPVRGDLVARVKAKAATFDRDTDRLTMTKPFTVTLSSGLKAEFLSASLDIKAGQMSSPGTVSISAKNSTLVADSLNMTDKGRVIRFVGNVRLSVDPKAVRKNVE